DDHSTSGYAFSLVAGTGSDDNGSFQISGHNLSIKQGVGLNRPSFLVRVRLTDGPFTLEQPFELLVTSTLPVNHAPIFVAGSDPNVSDESGPQSFPAWAKSLSAGPGDGVQKLEFR